MKLDLEGNEIEVGVIYVLPADGSSLCIGRFSHETESSYIFKAVKYTSNATNACNLYSWKRQLPKYPMYNTMPVIKASQTLIDRYSLC